MKCEECLPLIEEYVDGELDGRMIERLDAHLSTCAACAEEMTALRREQEAYASYQRDLEVTPAHWNVVRARIEQEKDARPPAASRPRFGEWLGGLFGKRLRPAFVVAVVLVAVTITAAVIYLNSRSRLNELAVKPVRQNETTAGAGAKGTPPPMKKDRGDETVADNQSREKKDPDHRAPLVAKNMAAAASRRKTTGREVPELPLSGRNFTLLATLNPGAARASNAGFGGAGPDARQFNNGDPMAGSSFPSGSVDAPAAGGEFDFEMARHAERSELLLRSFRNVRPVTSADRPLDVSFEKAQSRKLLYRNIALRRAAEDRGDPSALKLLNTLEPILLDIANLPGRARARDVESIERRMEKKEIVAALQVRTLLASN
jgi:hypothetical protein